mmetsp:Transcript_7479/g.12206  ORF Transcript_7479/g.12206 Transcript_7479/m.12206 type:complete len:207 (+) Transcript_7479:659-1279(+)
MKSCTFCSSLTPASASTTKLPAARLSSTTAELRTMPFSTTVVDFRRLNLPHISAVCKLLAKRMNLPLTFSKLSLKSVIWCSFGALHLLHLSLLAKLWLLQAAQIQSPGRRPVLSARGLNSFMTTSWTSGLKASIFACASALSVHFCAKATTDPSYMYLLGSGGLASTSRIRVRSVADGLGECLKSPLAITANWISLRHLLYMSRAA